MKVLSPTDFLEENIADKCLSREFYSLPLENVLTDNLFPKKKLYLFYLSP